MRNYIFNIYRVMFISMMTFIFLACTNPQQNTPAETFRLKETETIVIPNTPNTPRPQQSTPAETHQSSATQTIMFIHTPKPDPASTSFNPSLPITSTEAMTQTEIAASLLTTWLEHYKGNALENTHFSLDDYEIVKIEIPEKLQVCAAKQDMGFIATIYYSVKPSQKSGSSWAAGSGEISADRLWINNKVQHVMIFANENAYTWKLLGNPPCNPGSASKN